MRLTGDLKKWKKNSGKIFPHAGTVEENTLKSFCYFSALDLAPTWAGPGLLVE